MGKGEGRFRLDQMAVASPIGNHLHRALNLYFLLNEGRSSQKQA